MQIFSGGIRKICADMQKARIQDIVPPAPRGHYIQWFKDRTDAIYSVCGNWNLSFQTLWRGGDGGFRTGPRNVPVLKS